MRILITNDDGIASPGIIRLAELASAFGEIYVAAPDEQKSAMSHSVTISHPVKVRSYDFPVPVKAAWSICGTPADCVKGAVRYLMKDCAPDIVFSGINNGFNTGFDSCYSGTVGAGMESVLNGIPAIAFSAASAKDLRVAGAFFREITEELLAQPLYDGIWNVNFPSCSVEECKGIRRGVKPAPYQMYRDSLFRESCGEGYEIVGIECVCPTLEDTGDGNTDVQSVLGGYISVGKLRNMVL